MEANPGGPVMVYNSFAYLYSFSLIIFRPAREVLHGVSSLIQLPIPPPLKILFVLKYYNTIAEICYFIDQKLCPVPPRLGAILGDHNCTSTKRGQDNQEQSFWGCIRDTFTGIRAHQGIDLDSELMH